MRLVLDDDGPGSYGDILEYMETAIRENCVMREGAMVTAVREDKEARLARAMLTSVLARMGVERPELSESERREGKNEAELHPVQPPVPRLNLEAFNVSVQEQNAMVFQNAAHTQYSVAIPCPQCGQTTQWVEGQSRDMDRNTYRMQPCGHEVPSDARPIVVDENGYLWAQDPES